MPSLACDVAGACSPAIVRFNDTCLNMPCGLTLRSKCAMGRAANRCSAVPRNVENQAKWGDAATGNGTGVAGFPFGAPCRE